MDQNEAHEAHSVNEIIMKLIIILDQIFGMRAVGLIFYGSLPAYLALVGVLNIDIENFNNLPSHYLIIAISLFPIALTFTLVKIQQKRWYVTKDFLITRSLITTVFIFSMAYLISLISGMIRRGYDLEILKILDPDSYNRLTTEALIVSIVSLVISSTFIVSSLKKEIDLPGLPSVELSRSVKSLQKNLKEIVTSNIWNDYVSLGDNQLIKSTDKAIEEFEKIKISHGDFFSKKTSDLMHKDILKFKVALEEIKKQSINKPDITIWKIYFKDVDFLDAEEISERKERAEIIESIKRLKKLKISD